MKLEFIDEQHKKFFLEAPDRFNFSANDIERLSMFYVFGLMPELRNNVTLLYDATNGFIIPEGLNEGFQTSGTSSLTRLGFVLFNNFQEKKKSLSFRKDDDSFYYTYPSLLNIFANMSSCYHIFMFMAIELRLEQIEL